MGLENKLYFYNHTGGNEASIRADSNGQVIIETGLSSATRHTFLLSRDGGVSIDGKEKITDYVSGRAVDANTTTTTGTYYATAGTLPAGSPNGALEVIAWSDLWVSQRFMCWRSNKTFSRVRPGNNDWSAWKEL